MVILFVEDITRAKAFYATVFQTEPIYDEPNMVQFNVSNQKIGLMPEDAILKTLSHRITRPRHDRRDPQMELYLYVDNPELYYQRLIQAGGSQVSPLKERDWGDFVAYGIDLDNHLLAFATPSRNQD